MNFRFMVLIGVVLLCGCTGKYYEREQFTINPNGVVNYEYIKVKLDTSAVNAEVDNILVSTVTDPNGTVTRTLSTGKLKQDISVESVEALSKGVTKAIITAITHIPQ